MRCIQSQLGPREGDFLSKQSREEEACHEGTPSPHLLRVCMTGSLALHLQNYSRLCGSDLSVFKEFGQLSRSEELPCGAVIVCVCVVLIEWVRKTENKVERKYAHWTETTFSLGFILFILHTVVVLWKPGLSRNVKPLKANTGQCVYVYVFELCDNAFTSS